MPNDWPTTIGLIIATLASAAATVVAWLRWRARAAESSSRFVSASIWLIAAIAVGLLVYRGVTIHDDWRPLTTHVDGLLLLVGLLGLAVAYLQSVGRMRGLDLFVLPIVTIALLWAVCASWWTFNTARFDITGVWGKLHIIVVYLGVAAAGLAAAIGAMYLVARRQLRRRDDPAAGIRLLGRMASLEAIEANLLRAATAGFILLTLALGLGIVQAATAATQMDPAWWAQPKIWGAAAAWAALGLVMNARVNPRLRGRAAAAVSLAGFVVLLAVLAVALSAGGCSHYDDTIRIGSDDTAIDVEGTP